MTRVVTPSPHDAERDEPLQRGAIQLEQVLLGAGAWVAAMAGVFEGLLRQRWQVLGFDTGAGQAPIDANTRAQAGDGFHGV